MTAPATPAPDDGLLEIAPDKARTSSCPPSQSLGPIRSRPGAARARRRPRWRKIQRQAAQFGGTATDGRARTANEKHLFVDLPAAATAAFRLAVETNAPADAASPAPDAARSFAGSAGAASLDHIEVIIRPAGDDE